MKRFHVHVRVEDLGKNITFYSAMFGQEPARMEADYAKWILTDPPVNFAISTRGDAPGVDHLGIQVETQEELAAMKSNAARADTALLDEGETTCCYARSDKYWITDPQGIAWEQFRTLESIPVYGASGRKAGGEGACCVTPRAATVSLPSSRSSCC